MKQTLGIAFLALIFLGIWVLFSIVTSDPTEAQYRKIAESWIQKESLTYTFDGSNLKLVASSKMRENIFDFKYTFDSSQAGYGDRTGLVLAQVITPHEIIVRVSGGKVADALTDGVYNEIRGKMLVEEEGEPVAKDVSLYFYNQAMDTDETGNILCNASSVVPVTRTIINYSIEKHIQAILDGPTQEEKTAGLSSEFPLTGVDLVNVSGPDPEGALTITLSDPNHKTVGGSCRITVLGAQIWKTALTIPGVKEVVMKPEDLFQP